MLHVENLSCGYGRTTVVSAVTFEVARGEVMVMLGPNGAGKTTLFRTLLGLQRPLGGTVTIDGTPLGARNGSRSIAYVPQSHVASFSFTVADVVTMGRTPLLGRFATPSQADRRAALAELDQLGLAHLADRDYTRISGGEQQMVLVARALAQQAPIVMMDEPASSLDLGNQARLLSTVRSLARERSIAVVLSTHNPDHAFLVADRALLVQNGSARFGSVDDICERDALAAAYGTPLRLLEGEPDAQGRRPRACQILLDDSPATLQGEHS